MCQPNKIPILNFICYEKKCINVIFYYKSEYNNSFMIGKIFNNTLLSLEFCHKQAYSLFVQSIQICWKINIVKTTSE